MKPGVLRKLLSDRECRSVAVALLLGFHSPEICEILSISQSQLDDYRKDLYFATGIVATNKTARVQFVLKANAAIAETLAHAKQLAEAEAAA